MIIVPDYLLWSKKKQTQKTVRAIKYIGPLS